MASTPKAETKETPDSRSLTEGEIELARQYFGDKIDYSKVKIGKKTGMLAALTGDNAVTPDGNIYMPESAYKADYSKESVDAQAHFMHEMTHVWQKQAGRSVVAEAATQFVKAGGDYKKAYQDDGSVAFKDMNLEQQGEFVAAAVKSGGASKYMDALRAAGIGGASDQDVAEAPQAGKKAPQGKAHTGHDHAHDHEAEEKKAAPKIAEAPKERAGKPATEQEPAGSVISAQAMGRIAGDPMPDPVAEAEAAGRRIAAHSLVARREQDIKADALLAGVHASLGDMELHARGLLAGHGGGHAKLEKASIESISSSLKGVMVAGASETGASAHPSGLSGGAAKQSQLLGKA